MNFNRDYQNVKSKLKAFGFYTNKRKMHNLYYLIATLAVWSGVVAEILYLTR